jgi:hypothetical protein
VLNMGLGMTGSLHIPWLVFIVWKARWTHIRRWMNLLSALMQKFVNCTFMKQGVCVLWIINFLILVINSATLIGIICSEWVMESFELK